MSNLDPRLELLLRSSDFSDDQKQSLRDTWFTIRAKGNVDSLGTQQAVFSFALATSMASSLQKLEEGRTDTRLLSKLENIEEKLDFEKLTADISSQSPSFKEMKEVSEELKIAIANLPRINQGVKSRSGSLVTNFLLVLNLLAIGYLIYTTL